MNGCQIQNVEHILVICSVQPFCCTVLYADTLVRDPVSYSQITRICGFLSRIFKRPAIHRIKII